MQDIRKNGISAELYHDSVKLDKQFKYADKKKIAYAVILGSKEIAEKICMVKDLKTGLQESVAIDGLTDYLINKISAE
jgi:histidyl-tRNA synthetase